MEQLNGLGNIPLEREFEGWIISQIEDYFKTHGINYFIRALSPTEESNFPADELLSFSDSFKILGLQFKRPSFSTRQRESNSIEDLKWDLGSPTNQFQNILGLSGIYYCLPIFTNRLFKVNSLGLCQFWRPTKQGNSLTYYLKGNNQIDDSMNWSVFIQKLMQCKIGHKLTSANLKAIERENTIETVLNELKTTEIKIKHTDDENNVIYFIGIEI